MPLLAGLIAGLVGGLAEFFAKYFTQKVALALASYIAYLAIIAAFATSVYVCLSSLLGMVQGFLSGGGGGGGSGWLSYLFMGLGMFIPSNAGAVMSCVGSVWIGCAVYRMQRIGVIEFSR